MRLLMLQADNLLLIWETMTKRRSSMEGQQETFKRVCLWRRIRTRPLCLTLITNPLFQSSRRETQTASSTLTITQLWTISNLTLPSTARSSKGKPTHSQENRLLQVLISSLWSTCVDNNLYPHQPRSKWRTHSFSRTLTRVSSSTFRPWRDVETSRITLSTFPCHWKEELPRAFTFRGTSPPPEMVTLHLCFTIKCSSLEATDTTCLLTICTS